MHPNTQTLFNQLATATAHFRCVPGVDQYDRASSLFRFGARVLNKLRPGDICNALAHAAAFPHLLGLQLFKDNDLKIVHQIARLLMGEILTPEPDALTISINATSPAVYPTYRLWVRVPRSPRFEAWE